MFKVHIQTEPLHVSRPEVSSAADASSGACGTRGTCGAEVRFVGRVRNDAGASALTHLELEHFPGVTEGEIERILEEARQRWALQKALVVHRVGRIAVGEDIIVVETASAHRRDAYEANVFIMDYLKTQAPFWKRECFADGTAKWVEARASDQAAAERWHSRPAPIASGAVASGVGVAATSGNVASNAVAPDVAVAATSNDSAMAALRDYHDALSTLLETHAPIAGEESVPLTQLNQRVLAHDVAVQFDVPAFDNSAMDGYAICGNHCSSWKVVHRVAAGDAADYTLTPGQAARIFTGAPVPAGTTAVLMQEDVELDAQHQHIALAQSANGTIPIQDGMHIRRQAAELQHGTKLLSRFHRMTPATIGLLAAQGYTRASCVPQVRVTVFSSGNELIEPGETLAAGKIYDSNRHMLVALLAAEGFAVTDGGILPDQLAATRDALVHAAASSDAIVCSGGVSVGEEDHLKTALEEVGQLTQWRLRIKPGKPFTWGSIGTCRVFMLPGNPVSSLVTFQQLTLPALHRLAGLPIDEARPWQLQARADFTRAQPDSRREFVRVSLQGGPDGFRVRPMTHQGSAMLSGAAHAHALAEIPPGATVEPGQILTVYPLGSRF